MESSEKNNKYQMLDEDTVTKYKMTKVSLLTNDSIIDKNIQTTAINQNSYNSLTSEPLSLKERQVHLKIKSDLDTEEISTDDFNLVTQRLRVKSISPKNDVVVLRNIHKTYLIGVEGVPALRGVSLKVKRGEYVVILGTSGGGKTTMLNVIGTIDTPSRGDVKIFDTIIRSNTKDEILSSIRLDQVAFVFQSFNLLPNLNVVENVEVPMKIKGELSSDEIRKRAIDLLEKVGLINRLNHFPNQLSGGEQQRVTIARALSNKPKILLLDEPTGDLDTKNSDIVMNILIDLNINEKITMIMVTHDVGLKSYANRVVRVVDGKINTEYSIDNHIRNENIQKLKDRIANKFQNLREGVNNSNTIERDNTNNSSNFVENTTRTFLRKFSEYKIKKVNNNL